MYRWKHEWQRSRKCLYSSGSCLFSPYYIIIFFVLSFKVKTPFFQQSFIEAATHFNWSFAVWSLMCGHKSHPETVNLSHLPEFGNFIHEREEQATLGDLAKRLISVSKDNSKPWGPWEVCPCDTGQGLLRFWLETRDFHRLCEHHSQKQAALLCAEDCSGISLGFVFPSEKTLCVSGASTLQK